MHLTRHRCRGFSALLAAMLLMAVPLVVFLGHRYGDSMLRLGRTAQAARAQNLMDAWRPRLTDAAADVDADGAYEPLADDGGAVPAALGTAVDPWGTALTYCTWDPGAANGSDPAYSQNFVAPPRTDLIARLISAGADRTLQSACGDAAATGDDLFSEIYHGEARISANGDGSAWLDSGAVVSLTEPSASVGIGTDPPQAKLDVSGAINLGTTAGSTEGTLRYSGGALQGYDGRLWQNFATGTPTASTTRFDATTSDTCNTDGTGVAANTAPTASVTVTSAGAYLLQAQVESKATASADRPITWTLKKNGTAVYTITDEVTRFGSGAWNHQMLPLRTVNLYDTTSTVSIEASGAADLSLRCLYLNLVRLY